MNVVSAQIETSERVQIVSAIKRLPPWNAIQRMTPDQKHYYDQRRAYYALLGTAIDDYFRGRGDQLAEYKGDHVQLVKLDRDFRIALYAVLQGAWHMIEPLLPSGCGVCSPGQALYVVIALEAKADMQVTNHFADYTASRVRRLDGLVTKHENSSGTRRNRIAREIKSLVAVEYPSYQDAHRWTSLLIEIARTAPKSDRAIHLRLRHLAAAIEELRKHTSKMVHPQKKPLSNRWKNGVRLA